MGENSDNGFEMFHKATAMVVEPQISVVSQREQNDRYELARLGKKSVLKVRNMCMHFALPRQRCGANQTQRNFGFMSFLGFSCAVLITWEGALVWFQQGLQNGGPAGIIYNFLFVWTGNLALFSTLSELVSMAPTSGGQYHWVAMLAPRSCSKFLSYLTGWMAIAGWQGSVASAGFLMATMIQGLIKMTP